jgi:DNA-binding NtrC family response regulator
MRRWFGRSHSDSCGDSCSGTQLILRPAQTRVLRLRSQKPKLIAVDPDPEVLNFISAAAEPWYHVIAARDSCWAKAWLLQYHDVGAIVVSEHLSCGEGDDLLDRCRIVRPDVLRVLVTPRIESRRSVGALMHGVAQRLVEWPMSVESLRGAIDPAMPDVLVA